MTQLLRGVGVVGRFVEFFGPGAARLTLPDRATIANMAPEYGATVGFFAVDHETLRYLTLTARSAAQVDTVREYCAAQGLLRVDGPEPEYTRVVEFDLGDVVPSMSPAQLQAVCPAVVRFVHRVGQHVIAQRRAKSSAGPGDASQRDHDRQRACQPDQRGANRRDYIA